MSEKGLPTGWVVFDPCPKCGATVPKVVFRGGGTACLAFNREHYDIAAEHFHATCWRCGHGWVADLKGGVV